MSIFALHTSGCDFYGETQNEPPRAVFVHGFAGDLHTWDSLWEALGPKLSALRYDLRGFGQSRSREPTPYDHAEDLLEILDAVGIKQCDLIGVSMGGSIALNFTLSHLPRVRSLVLISPGLIGWERSKEWRRRSDEIESLARSGALDEAKRLWWEHPMFRTTRMSPAGPALLESIVRYSGAQWIHDNHKPVLADIERLHLLTMPTLLLTGGLDLEESRLIADVIASSAPAVRHIEEPERGHLLHLEDPERCARHIRGFWKTLRGAK